MTDKKRKHQVVAEVSLDRPLEEKRVRNLLENAMKSIHGMGRDLSRPGLPEAKLIRAEIKTLSRVTAAHRRVSRDSAQKVWVIMGNDYPHAVRFSEGAADELVAKLKADDAVRWKQEHPNMPAPYKDAGNVFWRSYTFVSEE